MLILETHIPCEHPDKLLLKLCKHFRHKVPADFSAACGHVDFQPGLCLMRVRPGELELRIEGSDDTALNRARGILDSHLPRFLANEGFVAEWVPPAGNAARA